MAGNVYYRRLRCENGIIKLSEEMSKYNVKVDGQIYQVEVNDAETNTTNNEESSASICFEAIKAEYDYCVTRAEKLENKVYIL